MRGFGPGLVIFFVRVWIGNMRLNALDPDEQEVLELVKGSP